MSPCRSLLQAALPVILLLSLGAFGQASYTAQIRGVVTDQTGAMVPNATVTITNDATGTTVTGRMGRGPEERGAAIEAEGTVKQALHGPRGEANGVLLELVQTIK